MGPELDVEKGQRRVVQVDPAGLTGVADKGAVSVTTMIRDGLVKAHKRPGKGKGGRWYVPINFVDRFKR